MKTLKYYDTLFEAHVVKGLLESEGIPAIVLNENLGQVIPYSIPTTGSMDMRPYIVVADPDIDRALEVINYGKAKNEATACPACGSEKIKFGTGGRSVGVKTILRGIFLPMGLLFGLPIGHIEQTYYCKNCKHEFKR